LNRDIKEEETCIKHLHFTRFTLRKIDWKKCKSFKNCLTCRIEVDKLLRHEHVFLGVERGSDRPTSGRRSGPELFDEPHRLESGQGSVPEATHLVALVRRHPAGHEVVLGIGKVLRILQTDKQTKKTNWKTAQSFR